MEQLAVWFTGHYTEEWWLHMPYGSLLIPGSTRILRSKPLLSDATGLLTCEGCISELDVPRNVLMCTLKFKYGPVTGLMMQAGSDQRVIWTRSIFSYYIMLRLTLDVETFWFSGVVRCRRVGCLTIRTSSHFQRHGPIFWPGRGHRLRFTVPWYFNLQLLQACWNHLVRAME